MMKRYLWMIGLCAVMVGSMAACAPDSRPDGARIELLNNSWKLNFPRESWSELDGETRESKLVARVGMEKEFSIRCKVNIEMPTFDRLLVEIPGVLDVCLRQHNPLDRNRQNYPAYRMEDGSVPVLEAGLVLKSPIDGREERMAIGFPVAMLEKPLGEHELVLNFSGVRWTMFVDGKLVDNDFPIGYPAAGKMKSWKINPDFVSRATLYSTAVHPERKEGTEARVMPQLQYWTPQAHNAWVGDVVSLYHKGRYHLFYLYDRRGHQSKFGKGGHYFEHLSTADFRHWTEHEAAVPIDEQWETFGTGTPFVWKNRLCLSYGYHTTRIYPREQTTLPAMYEYLEENGCTGAFDRHTLAGVPAGSSYAVSDDGIHFRKTGKLFHPCENPSVYTDADGRLKMLANYGARGTWTSDSIDGGWRCIDQDFPPGGDCTFFFHWGDYDYIIGGFTRLWAKQESQPDSAYQDMAAKGWDFYNGISVPTIAEIPGGRFVMAGWLWMKAWGGPLVIHELTQLPDGRIGTQWMDELLPVSGQPQTIDTKDGVDRLPSTSFLLTFDVVPQQKDYRIGISFLPNTCKGWQDACEWSIDGRQQRAQYAPASPSDWAGQEASLREGGAPQQCRNYSIENLINTDQPFKVRMIVKQSDKFDGTLLDTEIDGQRTMLSYREKLSVERLHFHTAHAEIQNVSIAPLLE